MHLYNLTLQHPTAIVQAIVGNFREQGSKKSSYRTARVSSYSGLIPDREGRDRYCDRRLWFNTVAGCISTDWRDEGHKNSAIIHHIVGVDVGFENPMFAALEVDYSESDQDPQGGIKNAEKMLTYYELDLGLNHVVRKWSEPTDPRANLLVQVPGGQLASSDRFDGLLVFSFAVKSYHLPPYGCTQHRIPIPRRSNPLEDPNRGIIITAAVMHKMKDGDLFKVTIDHEDEEVKAVKIKYFDTVPVASSLCILKSGFLFVASEFGNQ
ncbi:pre-mRNA-splicing factor rse [Salix suchowensis]|nr:pre-mRNA-splicing factor rse [Salix suchowensis]